MELSDRPLILQLIKLEESSQRQCTGIDARVLLDGPWCRTCRHEKMSLELALILYLISQKTLPVLPPQKSSFCLGEALVELLCCNNTKLHI